MCLFSKQSIRFKLMFMLTCVNLAVLLLVATGFIALEYGVLSPQINIGGRSLNVVPFIFAAAFLGGFLLSAVLQRFLSKRIDDLAEYVRASPFAEPDEAAKTKNSADEVDQIDFLCARYEEIQRAFQTSEARYALASQGAQDGLWDWDLKTDQIYFSPRWLALLGYEVGEIGAEPSEWFDRIYPEDYADVKAAISAHLKGDTPHFEHVFRMQHKEGGCRWMLSRALLLRDEQGAPARLGGSQSDVTSQKGAEQHATPEAA